MTLHQSLKIESNLERERESMKILTLEDFAEETYWVWQCKICDQYVDEFREPETDEIYICDNCGENFKMVD